MGRMRIVQKPLPFMPKRCIVSGRADGDVVDFGVDTTIPVAEPHIYIKRDIVEKAGKICGMLSEAEVATLQAERDKLIAENASLHSELKTTNLHHRAESAQLAYAGAAAASKVIADHNPGIELPNEAIIAAAEELVEPTKEEILNESHPRT